MAEAPYTTDLRDPYELLRGLDTVVSVTVSRGTETIELGDATAALVKPDGTVVFTATATTDGATAEATFDGSLTSEETPGEGWIVRWTIEVSSLPSRSIRIQNPAMVVLYTVTPTVTRDDLLSRHDDFRNLKTDETERNELLDGCLRDAWRTVCALLRQKGRRPYLVLDSGALFEPLALKALELAWHRCAQGPDTDEWGQYKDYEAKFKDWWGTLTFSEADPTTYLRSGTRSSASPTTWLGSGRGTGRYRPVQPTGGR